MQRICNKRSHFFINLSHPTHKVPVDKLADQWSTQRIPKNKFNPQLLLSWNVKKKKREGYKKLRCQTFDALKQ